MPKRRVTHSNDENPIAVLVGFAIVGIALAVIFRHAIISWFINTLTAIAIAIVVIVLGAIPFLAGFCFMKYLAENNKIESGRDSWMVVVLCVVGLILLGMFPLGYYINVALTLLVLGILGFFGWDLIKDVFDEQSGGYLSSGM